MRVTSTLFLSATLAIVVAACAGGTDGGLDDSDTVDADSDTTYVPDDTAVDTGSDSDGGGGGFTVTFDDERYQVDELEVLKNGGVDLDGDGVVDNKVGTLLNALASIGSLGISLDQVNENIAYLLDNEGIIVLMRATHEQGYQMHLDVVLGQRDVIDGLEGMPDQYNDNGEPNQRLPGRFTKSDHFSTDGGELALPFQFSLFEPTLLVSAEQIRSEVDVDEFGAEGYLAGAFPVEKVMKDIIEPLIYNFYADPGQAETTLGLVRSLVVSAADIDVGTDDPKLSGAFRFKAHVEPWSEPQ